MSDLNEQLAALKAAAEAATPGPWATTEVYADNGEYDGLRLYGDVGVSIIEGDGAMGDNDARYIAAANPAAILALIEEVEVARRAPAAAPAPVAANILMELRERIKEMQESAYTFGEYSKEAACAALDGVLDEIDALAAAPAAAPIVQPPVELSPRQLADENEPDGYLESDREFFERNAKLVRWYLEHDASIRAAIQAPVVQAEPANVRTTEYHRGYQAGIEIGKAMAADEAAPTTSTADAKDAALEQAAKICDAKYSARVASGHPREASTARALAEEIRAAIATSADEVKHG